MFKRSIIDAFRLPRHVERSMCSRSNLRGSNRSVGIKVLSTSMALTAMALFICRSNSQVPIQNMGFKSVSKDEELVEVDYRSELIRSKDRLSRMVNQRDQSMRERMSGFVKLLQLEIVDALSSLEEVQTFRWDHWKRESDGGYGTSCVLQGGLVFEKAGVNISNVQGHLPPGAIRQMRDRLDCDRFSWWDGKSHLPFFASGISLVIHPSNPNAPTVHLNYRYFEIDDPIDESNQVWWFGGGSDLTPSYLFEEDCIQFHRSLKDACDRHDRGYYQKFKEWCDRYFYIPHRDETRGIGGIFFDDQSGKEASDDDRENLFGFVRDLGKSFVPTYLSILERRRSMNYCDRQKLWQQLRRGRYVEFNLIYDRGTKFGLATPGARIESILMSLPLTARWEYMTSLSPLKNSSSSEPQRDRADSDCLGERDLEGEEENLLKVLKRPKDWV